MRSKSIFGNEINLLQASLEKALVDGFKPTLAISFLPQETPVEPIQKLFREKGIQLFGSHTPGTFTDASIVEQQISVLLLDGPSEAFGLFLDHFPHSTKQEVAKVAQTIAKRGKALFENPAFIITVADFHQSPGHYILEGFRQELKEDVKVIGGMAGGAPFVSNGKVFTQDQMDEKGIITLIVDQDKIDVSGLAVSGWKPAGAPKTITQSEGSWVQTIDDKPALDMLLKFMGVEMEMENVEDLWANVGVTSPLQMVRENGNAVMNPPIMYNRDTRAVQFGMPVPQGAQVRFSLPPDFDIVEDVIESAQTIKQKELPEADAMIIFSCIGRLQNLGPLLEDELNGLAATWNTPSIGYYCLGEFGTPEGGAQEFHGTTCSWVALKEK